MIEKSILFAIVGLGLEVFFTAVVDAIYPAKIFQPPMNQRKFLFGYSSLTYIPLYALAYPIFLSTYNWLFSLPIVERAIFYGLAFLVLEIIWMFVLKLILGQSPSEHNYLKAGGSLWGLTKPIYIPAFMLAGFALEWLFKSLK